LPVIFCVPEKLLDAVVAEYAVTNLLKFSMVIWSVVPLPTESPITIGTTLYEPDIVWIKGSSVIFLVAIYQYYFKKVGFQLI
jgi:hypothetical protein